MDITVSGVTARPPPKRLFLTQRIERLSILATRLRPLTKTITDFNPSNDYLDLNGLAISLKLKLNAGASTSTWKRGDIISKVDGNDTLVLGNLNADKDPEMIIRLVGVTRDVTNQIGLGTD